MAVFHLKTGCIGPQEKYTVDNFVANYVIGFSNRAQRFTGSNYLDVDSPLKGIA